MKKLLYSVMTIGIATALLGAGTFAYFSDNETITGNTFSSGTVDIKLNPDIGQQVATITDDVFLKPCEVGYIEFTVTNTGNNPVIVWKHIAITAEEDFITSGPEHEADETDTVNDISNWILYDLIVTVDTTPVVVISEDDGFTLNDIACVWMPLDTIEPGQTVHVKQSYHLKPETPNEYQGDLVRFDITMFAEQRLGPGPEQKSSKLFLDDKTYDPDWYFIINDKWAILDYWEGASFDYDLYARGLDPSTTYALIYYPEPQTIWPHPIELIGVHDSGPNGFINVQGESSDTVGPFTDGKIWLVHEALLTEPTVGDWRLDGPWPPTGVWLFESNLVSFPYT